MSDRWYVAKQGPNGPKKFGPATLEQLQQLATSGKLKPDDLLCREGMPEWVAAATMFQLPARGTPALPPIPPTLPEPVIIEQPLQYERGKNYPVPLYAEGEDRVISQQSRGVASWVWLVSAGAMLVVAISCVGFSALIMTGRTSPQAAPENRSEKPQINVQAPQPPQINVQPPPAPRRSGSVTFAEYVDPQTFITKNEGTVFSQGLVYLLIRSNLSFGDSKLILSCRPHGSTVWTVLREYTVDPGWDRCSGVFPLDGLGDYTMKVTTSRGEVIAENAVRVIP
jgi:GYF domain 2